MENNEFFTPEEHKQLIQLYKRLLLLSKDTLQKDDCHKLKNHLIKAMSEGTIPRNVFQMNPIIKDMQTAVIVAEEIGMRRASILGIMLHESVKYNLYSLESVKEEYGEDVAGIIRGLVKINELYSKSPIIESENFRNLLLSFAEDMRVILIIIADRVNLMRQIKDSPNEEARLEVANEAAYLYAPLAHKLGLYKLKSELEDLSLKYTQHDVYYYIKDKLNATKQARDRYIDVDELSLVIYPGIDGSTNSTSIFHYIGKGNPSQGQSLELLSVQTMENGVIWLRYKFHKNS